MFIAVQYGQRNQKCSECSPTYIMYRNKSDTALERQVANSSQTGKYHICTVKRAIDIQTE